jgi:hypothetical protein
MAVIAEARVASEVILMPERVLYYFILVVISGDMQLIPGGLLGFELVRQNQIRKGDDFLVCGDYVVVDI